MPTKVLADRPSETELKIQIFNARGGISEIFVVGLDRPERIEGRGWDFGVIDEIANTKQGSWGENIRPALADRGGGAWLIGVPEGRGFYHDLYLRARADDTGEWAAFHWVSADILPPAEIAAARRDLDELTYQQEYEGSFVSFHGRAYPAFSDKTHCAPLAYDATDELALCFDFNTSPGVAAVCQEQVLPNGLRGTGVIGEVWIPQNSTTLRVCDRLIADWGHHRGRVVCYGDATGGAGGSAKVAGSDWDLIRGKLRPVFGARLSFRVPAANPKERARVNAVNSRLLSMSGEIRLMVDPRRAPHVVTDFEGVRVIEGGAGEIDKKSDPMLTHLVDALGYMVHERFPVVTPPPARVSRVVGLY